MVYERGIRGQIVELSKIQLQGILFDQTKVFDAPKRRKTKKKIQILPTILTYDLWFKYEIIILFYKVTSFTAQNKYYIFFRFSFFERSLETIKYFQSDSNWKTTVCICEKCNSDNFAYRISLANIFAKLMICE